MAGSKQGSYDCRSCGIIRQDDYHLSHTGQCPDCGEFHLVENIYGLVDPGSVPYKRWEVAYRVSHYGRPRNTPPPAAWIPRMASLQLRSVIDPGQSITFTE